MRPYDTRLDDDDGIFAPPAVYMLDANGLVRNSPKKFSPASSSIVPRPTPKITRTWLDDEWPGWVEWSRCHPRQWSPLDRR
jgi:hypothetical protein